MNKQPRLVIFLVFVITLVAQWLYSCDAFAADGEKNNASENLSDTVTNDPKTSHEKDVFKNILGMRFVLIQRGNFIMGSPSKEPGRTIFEAQHEIFIQKPFYIQTTEVTQGEWVKVMGDNPSVFFGCGEDCPVENVSWMDAQNFIKEISQMDSSSYYRLPTEAEWEFVCRSGSFTAFSNGDLINYECHKDNRLDEIAWYHCNSGGKTHPVGKKAPNNWGVYDMHGNVYEWCQDIYVTNYAKILKDELADLYSIADKVGRSCSFDDTAVSCRSAARVNFKPNVRSNAIGFRLVREPMYYKIQMPPSDENLKIFKANQQEFGTEKPEELVQPGKLEKKNVFILQIAAMKNEKNADQLVAQLKEKGYANNKLRIEIVEKGVWFVVQVGAFEDIQEAKKVQMNLVEDKIQSIILKNIDPD